MAQFISYPKKKEEENAVFGDKDSGLEIVVEGKYVGCDVCISHNKETGKDEVRVYETGGIMRFKKCRKLIAEFAEED